MDAREQARWREAAWDALESFADGIYYFLVYTEHDWIASGRTLAPPSSLALDAGIRHVRDIERRGVVLGHVLPGSPELALFIDAVSKVLSLLTAWEHTAIREAFADGCREQAYGVVWGTEGSSRFLFARNLVYEYRKMTPQLDRYLRGNYSEGLVWDEDELRPLNVALGAESLKDVLKGQRPPSPPSTKSTVS